MASEEIEEVASKEIEEAREHFKTARILFTNDEWMEADWFLSKAIALRPKHPLYHSNRALCNLMRKDWMLVEEGCRRVIELDPTNVKAYLRLGHALLHYKDFGQAVEVLEKGFNLSVKYSEEQDEIRRDLCKARYELWKAESTLHLSELRIHREACYTAVKEIYGSESNHLKCLEAVFADAFEAYTAKEVPGYLCCPILYDILYHPVILPGGITYERKSIPKHIAEAGEVDPIANELLEAGDLVPNLAIKEAADDFLKRNGWANHKEYVAF